MALYQIAASQPTGPWERIRSQLIRTGFLLLLYVLVWRVAQGQWLSPMIVAILGTVIFLGNLLTTFLWPREAPSGALDIDDDEIRLIWSRKVVRTVRRDHILCPRVGKWAIPKADCFRTRPSVHTLVLGRHRSAGEPA